MTGLQESIGKENSKFEIRNKLECLNIFGAIVRKSE
jgi:hypothetical protein